MISLFAPSVNDQSLVYLYSIFGSMNGVIPAPGGAASSSTMVTLLGTMFKTFNSVVLAVGALIVVYITVVGIMNTAHEGKFMGKDWNNLWIPIRVVMGIASLVPTGSGYCGLQIVMMWVIVQGIGAADTLWGTALSYVNTMGSPFAQVSIPTTGVNASMKNLFSGLVCAKSAAATYPSPWGKDTRDGSYYCNANPTKDICSDGSSSTVFAPSFSNPAQSTLSFDATGYCGTMEYCNQEKSCAVDPKDDKSGPDSLTCLSCKSQIAALKDIIPTLAVIAQKYVDLDYVYTQFWVDSLKNSLMPPDKKVKIDAPQFVQSYCADHPNMKACTATYLPTPVGKGNYMSAPSAVINEIYWKYGLVPDIGNNDFVRTAVNYYTAGIGDTVNKYIAALMSASSTKVSGPLQEANDNGWILAGSYYHIVAKGNDSIFKAAIPIMTYEIESKYNPENNSSPFYKYRNNYSAASCLTQLAAGAKCNDDMMAMRAVDDGTKDSNAAFTTLVSNKGETDPLSQVIATGNYFLTIAAIVIFVFLALVLILAIIAGITNFGVLGTGFSGSPAFTISMELLMVLVPLVFLFVGILVSVGGLLGVYVPLIPFIVFLLGAISWLISTIEAMVAGPLVALGIISPSGHHEVLGKAEPALGLLFGIFLRPSLMIFGMMSAMLLVGTVIVMVNKGFDTLASSILNRANPVTALLVYMAYVNIIVVAVNKSFSLIYVLPERALSWINIQLPHEGAGEADQIKGAIGHAGEQATSAASSTTSGAGQAAISQGRQIQQNEKDKAKAKAKLQGGGGGNPPAGG